MLCVCVCVLVKKDTSMGQEYQDFSVCDALIQITFSFFRNPNTIIVDSKILLEQ